METNIAVKEMPAMDLIYCRHVGYFDQMGGAYEKLFKWAGPRGFTTLPENQNPDSLPRRPQGGGHREASAKRLHHGR